MYWENSAIPNNSLFPFTEFSVNSQTMFMHPKEAYLSAQAIILFSY